MSKTNKQEELNADKVMTKYDRKMQERKEKEAKDKKENVVSKITAIIVAVVVVAVIAIAIFVTMKNKKDAVEGTFMTVGEHEISHVEYDYYYNLMLTDYLNTYSSFLPYMGYDTTKAPEMQFYDEQRTWGDIIDEIAVEQIKETKALLDDGKAAGFVYETEDADYQAFVDGFVEQAALSGITVDEYYKTSFGEHATQANLEPFVRETLYVSAYANKLLSDFAPTEEEVQAYYEENKNDYDTVSYNVYAFIADVTDESTEDEVAAAMSDAETKALEMKSRVEAGENFLVLCKEYDGEPLDVEVESEEPVTNENAIRGGTYSVMTPAYADWVYDDARVEGDIETFKDEKNNRYYIVEFVEKKYHEDTNVTISNQLASEEVLRYNSTLTEKYEVVDVAGELYYLTLEDETTAE